MENVNKFLDYLKYERGYSSYTIINYQDDLKKFFIFLKREELNYLNLEYSDIRRYLIYLNKELNEKNSSICRNLSGLRSFYNYLLYKKVTNNNPFIYIEGPKKEKRLPRYFEYNEMEELFSVPDIKDALGQRDRLILELLYASGMRVGELCSVKVSDINKNERKIFIVGKGNKERYVYYGEYCMDILDLYLSDGYIKLNKTNSPYLLINNKGFRLTERGVRDILTRVIKKTSIKKNISPHMIRHTFATHLINEGCNVLSVQKLLGHESIAATGIYTHVSESHLKDVYYNSFPRAKMKR